VKFTETVQVRQLTNNKHHSDYTQAINNSYYDEVNTKLEEEQQEEEYQLRDCHVVVERIPLYNSNPYTTIYEVKLAPEPDVKRPAKVPRKKAQKKKMIPKLIPKRRLKESELKIKLPQTKLSLLKIHRRRMMRSLLERHDIKECSVVLQRHQI